MKFFITNVMHTVELHQDYFGFDLLSVIIGKQRKLKTYLAHSD